MKSQIEKKLFKEAKKIQIPDNLDTIYESIGFERNKRRTFFTKPKIITLSSVAALGIVAAVVIPLSVNTGNSYSESYVSLTITTATTSKSLKKQSTLVETSSSSEDTSSTAEEAEFTFYLDKNFKIDESKFFTLDDNSKIISYGLQEASTNLESYISSLMDSAIDTGYVNSNSVNGNSVKVLVSSTSRKTKEKVKSKIGSAIIKSLSEKYIYANLVDLVSNATQAQIDKAVELGIDLDKYILVEKVNSLYGGVDYSLEALSNMSYDELIQLVKTFYKCNYESNIITDTTKESLDEIKENFGKKMQDSFAKLDSLQCEIFMISDELRNYCHSNKTKLDCKYEEMIRYNYIDTLFSESIANNLDYHQMAMIPHEKPDKEKKENPYHSNTKDELLALLEEKVSSSKSEVEDVITALKEYCNEEQIIIDKSLTPDSETQYNQNLEETYNNRFSENHDKYKIHEQEWENNYKDHYKNENDYWNE